MNIKNDEVCRLIKRLSQLTGESMNAAVTQAVRERLERIEHKQGADLAERLLAIGRECATHLKEPYRTIDHDRLLYDQHGLPW
jgi:antitoxin VapB